MLQVPVEADDNYLNFQVQVKCAIGSYEPWARIRRDGRKNGLLVGYCPHPVTLYTRGHIKGYI